MKAVAKQAQWTQMIDTVRFRVQLTEPSSWPSGWKEKVSTANKAKFKRVTHQASRIRILNSPFGGWEIEASLSRVLCEANSHLLKSQGEIDRAWKKLIDYVGSACSIDTHTIEFVRVDLCWHVRGRIIDYIGAHLGFDHPKLDGKTIVYWNESIIWESKARKKQKRDVRLQMYDKYLQKTGRYRGQVVRLELQLRGEELKRTLGKSATGGRKSLKALQFDDCYQTLRSYFHGFLDSKRWQAGVIGRKEYAANVLPEYGIFWKTLLPKIPPKQFQLFYNCDLPVVPNYQEAKPYVPYTLKTKPKARQS